MLLLPFAICSFNICKFEINTRAYDDPIFVGRCVMLLFNGPFNSKQLTTRHIAPVILYIFFTLNFFIALFSFILVWSLFAYYTNAHIYFRIGHLLLLVCYLSCVFLRVHCYKDKLTYCFYTACTKLHRNVRHWIFIAFIYTLLNCCIECVLSFKRTFLCPDSGHFIEYDGLVPVLLHLRFIKCVHIMVYWERRCLEFTITKLLGNRTTIVFIFYSAHRFDYI